MAAMHDGGHFESPQRAIISQKYYLAESSSKPPTIYYKF